MNELLNKYKKQFGEEFPLMLFRSVSEEDISEIIEKCLKDGKPYEPNLDDSADY